ncbi:MULTISPECIES: hypothetical protein [Brevibacillus]|uniref:hypothetical protein n=1 Tax=Brevibacillus TaxID=55080 RepID=UPI001E651487|nr:MULTISPECIES: hypothetical protein [Brevibacillus]MED1947221.1 hypothetical protein [Brevibacillus formosus]MED1997512.1 hypothetical protein [Brevibacillus formosus]MED2083369.1 hypothetical protein [Brevibacillus formosus]
MSLVLMLFSFGLRQFTPYGDYATIAQVVIIFGALVLVWNVNWGHAALMTMITAGIYLGIQMMEVFFLTVIGTLETIESLEDRSISTGFIFQTISAILTFALCYGLRKFGLQFTFVRDGAPFSLYHRINMVILSLIIVTGVLITVLFKLASTYGIGSLVWIFFGMAIGITILAWLAIKRDGDYD